MGLNLTRYNACLACFIDKYSDEKEGIPSLLDKFQVAFIDFFGRIIQGHPGEYVEYRKPYSKRTYNELELELNKLELKII